MNAALALLLACSPARADAPIDAQRQRAVLAEAIAEHMAALRLPEAPPLYHLRYHLLALQQAQATVSFGALIERDASPANLLGIEVRLGGPAFDNTGFGGWESGFGRAALPAELTERALRLACWQLTDTTYKNAIEQYARKRAAFTPPPDYPGDFQVGFSRQGPFESSPPARLDAIEDLVKRLSALFPTGAGLELGTVLAAWETGSETVVDSEGTAVQRPHSELVLRAMAQARAEDGALLSDHRTWLLRDPGQIPPEVEVEAGIAAMAQDLLGWSRVPTLQEEYVGPVLFEDQAAVDLFRVLLVTQLEGTPPPIPYEARFGAIGEGFSLADDGSGGGPRLQRRVLPEGWRAWDDPGADPDDPSWFTTDLEGTSARRVELVRDGIVRELLMSRVPRRDLPEGTNGHARGAPGARPAGRVAQLTVQPGSRESSRRMLRRALDLAAAYGHDHVLVVRRFQDDLVRAEDRDDAGAFAFMDEEGPRLPVPLALYRAYADGRLEPLRGAAFARVDRWVLREIAAAGQQVEGRYLAPFEPGGQSYAPTVGMPTSLSVPEVLVEELELVPTSADPRARRVLPSPQP